jgi:hypothetical protein
MIKLNPDFLLKAIQGRSSSFASNLPEDIELLDIKYDLFSNYVFAIVRSDSFEDVKEAYPTPEFNVIYNSSIETEPKLKLKSPTKIAPKPIAIVKPKPKHPEKAPVVISQDVRAVEEEFNPEQRELLSFTVDGDYVIIKPNQYLKAEWNEINNIVKSLGGKWVKGDFFSYWEIPPE